MALSRSQDLGGDGEPMNSQSGRESKVDVLMNLGMRHAQLVLFSGCSAGRRGHGPLTEKVGYGGVLYNLDGLCRLVHAGSNARCLGVADSAWWLDGVLEAPLCCSSRARCVRARWLPGVHTAAPCPEPLGTRAKDLRPCFKTLHRSRFSPRRLAHGHEWRCRRSIFMLVVHWLGTRPRGPLQSRGGTSLGGWL